MRVLLSTIGSRGDIQPLVALALQLRARLDRPSAVPNLIIPSEVALAASRGMRGMV